MSKKIKIGVKGVLHSSLSDLFRSFVIKKQKSDEEKLENYLKLFPFLTQWAVDADDVEMILRYYGYIDKYGNVITDDSNSNSNNNEVKNDSRIDYWDNEDYWDEYEEIYPGPSEDDDYDTSKTKKRGSGGKYKHSKRGKRGKSRGSESDMMDITKPYSQGFIDEADDNNEDMDYHIWFYLDYHDKTDKLEFNSLKSFDDFCSSNEFVVPPYVGERIAYRPVSHVCLNPGAKERGVNEIMGAESFADMFNEAVEELQITYR